MDRPAIDMVQHALVTAGLADGIALSELLGHLGLDDSHWAEGSSYWDNLLLASLDDGPELALQFDVLQTEARKKWRRTIEPIEDDLRAWLSFEQYYSQHAGPAAYLAACGVTIAEIGRVTRKWAKRMSDDSAVREQAYELRAEVAALPTEEIILKPSERPRLIPAERLALEAGDGGKEHESAPQGEPSEDRPRDDDEHLSLPPPSVLSELPPAPEPPPAAAAEPSPKPPPKPLGRFGMGGGIDATGNMPALDDIVSAAGKLPYGPLSPDAARAGAATNEAQRRSLPANAPAMEAPADKRYEWSEPNRVIEPAHRAAIAPPDDCRVPSPPLPASSESEAAYVAAATAELPLVIVPVAAISAASHASCAQGDINTTGAVNLDMAALQALPFAAAAEPPIEVAELPEASDPEGDANAIDSLSATQASMPAFLCEPTQPLDDIAAAVVSRQGAPPAYEPTQSLAAVAAAVVAREHQRRSADSPIRKAKTGTVVAPLSLAGAPAPANDLQRLEAALHGLHVGPAAKGGQRYPLSLFAALMTTVERATTDEERDSKLSQIGLSPQAYQTLCNQLPRQLHTEAQRLAWGALRQSLAGVATATEHARD